MKSRANLATRYSVQTLAKFALANLVFRIEISFVVGSVLQFAHSLLGPLGRPDRFGKFELEGIHIAFEGLVGKLKECCDCIEEVLGAFSGLFQTPFALGQNSLFFGTG